MTSRVSRRAVLRMLVTGLGGSVLAACTTAPTSTKEPEAQATAVEQPTAVPAPTETPVPAPTELVTLRLTLWGGSDKQEKNDKAVRAVFPELNERSRTEFVVVDDVTSNLRLALAAGANIPDIVQFVYTYVPEFAIADELLVIDDYFEPVKDDIYPAVLNMCSYRGKAVGFPWKLVSKLFFYRPDYFDGAGINLEDLNTSAGFIEAGKKLHEKFPKSYIINLGPQPNEYLIDFLASADPDARVTDENGRYVLTEKKGFADAFKFSKDVFDAGITLRVDDWSSDWEQAFADEAIVGILTANWMKYFLANFAPKQGGKWKVALWPELSPMADQRYGSEGGGQMYVVPKRGAHTDLAADLLNKLWLTREGTVAAFIASGNTPCLKSAEADVMAYVKTAQKPEDVSDEAWALSPHIYYGTWYQELEFSSFDYHRALPCDPAALKELFILRDWLIKHLAGEADLQAALVGAQADMETQIGNPYNI